MINYRPLFIAQFKSAILSCYDIGKIHRYNRTLKNHKVHFKNFKLGFVP